MQRRSKKRESVYEALAASKDHPSAEELCLRVHNEMPDVSISTVYRNLAEFCNENRARVVDTVMGEMRYDADMSEHDHFICKDCGRIIDLMRTEAIKNVFESAEQLGMKPKSLTLYGICEICLNKSREHDAECF